MNEPKRELNAILSILTLGIVVHLVPYSARCVTKTDDVYIKTTASNRRVCFVLVKFVIERILLTTSQHRPYLSAHRLEPRTCIRYIPEGVWNGNRCLIAEL